MSTSDTAAEQVKEAFGSKIGNWRITKVLSSGTYGHAFMVSGDEDTTGVLKVPSKGRYNPELKFETVALERLLDANRTEHVVRLLDKGEAQNVIDAEDRKLVFMVTEFLPGSVGVLVEKQKKPADRQLLAVRLGAQLLRAISDMHSVGLLHRDLKTDNMALAEPPAGNVLKIFDLGCARFFTEGGELRQPRTALRMIGTREWASGRAELRREQARVDDLWSWFYCMVEWCNAEHAMLRMPWWDRKPKHRAWLKSAGAPVRLLLRNCPSQFYAVHWHLRVLRPDECPDYGFLGQQLKDAFDALVS